MFQVMDRNNPQTINNQERKRESQTTLNSLSAYRLSLEYQAEVALNMLAPEAQMRVNQVLAEIRAKGVVTEKLVASKPNENLYFQLVDPDFCIAFQEVAEGEIVVVDIFTSKRLQLLGYSVPGVKPTSHEAAWCGTVSVYGLNNAQ